MEKDIIIGIHSIVHAVRNPKRNIIELVATEEGVDNLVKMGGMSREEVAKLAIKLVSPHKLQEDAKALYSLLGYQFNRVPSGAYMVTNPVEVESPTWIFDQLESGRHLKIVCLDGVTDVHNAAAIMRTAAFYDVDCIVIAMKNNFGSGPNMARIASGALEYVKIVKCSSLPKFLSALKKRGVEPVGLTEHTDANEFEVIQGTRCLVMGAEDKGLSNATARLLDKKIRLNPQGKIESLNVSVAAAISMERIFS
jgi:23S rRNA (guanosine2251-2'-O)-methyltransferase